MYIIHCILSSIDFICIFYSFGIDYIRHNFITRFEHHWVVFLGCGGQGLPLFSQLLERVAKTVCWRGCGGQGWPLFSRLLERVAEMVIWRGYEG